MMPRYFLCLSFFALLFFSLSWAAITHTAEQPNILWLTSEDNSPFLGCYGDQQARTPNLDAFAAQGIRFRNAFSHAPVCSAARSTLITMMHASSLGLHNHRSSVAIPESFKPYTNYFKAAGYYCTNFTKTDYNAKNYNGNNIWDDTSKNAHYKNRKPGQPFFSVFNSTISHEGQLTDRVYEARRKAGKFPAERVVAPDKVILPPYHPDTPIIREDWSRYYDNIFAMDAEIGERLNELDASGEADNTIVFYYSDHGGALSRGKRDIHDSGTRVPLIIRFGKNFAHLAPSGAGTWVEQPVAFVDFAVTAMSLCGITVPTNVEGLPFLGQQKAAPRDHIFLFRGRMDMCYDTVRAVRTKEYSYVRNFSPHRSYGQHYSYAFNVQHNSQSWLDEFTAGRCNDAQVFYWLPKPAEELYDIRKDPYQIHNLANDPALVVVKEKLRTMLLSDMRTSCDTGLIPEGMYEALSGNKTLYNYVHSVDFPYQDVLTLADQASSRDAMQLPALIAAMDHTHPVIRYWGTQGCLILGKACKPAEAALRARLQDTTLSVRIAAAEALGHLGNNTEALSSLNHSLSSNNEFEIMEAANALERGLYDGIFTKDAVQTIFKNNPLTNDAKHISDTVLGIPYRKNAE
jgi:N-sulfoglucosamine sulfohydrolase